jgi:hypothetical protein
LRLRKQDKNDKQNKLGGISQSNYSQSKVF